MIVLTEASPAPSAPPPDPNVVAVRQAGVDPAHGAWLEQVAALVDGRLDAVRPDWRELPGAASLRPAVFGLILAVLSAAYPDTRGVLSRVAEAHPSYEALPVSRKLATLEGICASEQLIAEWVGPLLGVDDPAALRPLRTFGAAPEDPSTQPEGDPDR